MIAPVKNGVGKGMKKKSCQQKKRKKKIRGNKILIIPY